MQGNNNFCTFVPLPSQDGMRKTIENQALDTTYMVLKDGKTKKLKICSLVYKTSMHERWDSRYKIRKEKNKKFNKLG